MVVWVIVKYFLCCLHCVFILIYIYFKYSFLSKYLEGCSWGAGREIFHSLNHSPNTPNIWACTMCVLGSQALCHNVLPQRCTNRKLSPRSGGDKTWFGHLILNAATWCGSLTCKVPDPMDYILKWFGGLGIVAQHINLLLGTPTSCIRAPMVDCQLLFLWSSFLLMYVLESSSWWLKYLDTCLLRGRLG